MIPSEVKVEMAVTKAEIFEIFRSEMCCVVDTADVDTVPATL
jgi:hypothetical protein